MGSLVPTSIRSPDRPARSKSLYGLSYPGRWLVYIKRNIEAALLAMSQAAVRRPFERSVNKKFVTNSLLKGQFFHCPDRSKNAPYSSSST